MAFEINKIVPWGRSFQEYQLIFSLTQQDLGRTILGCADGPASFNAEATARGHCIASCDPIYDCSPEAIQQRIADSYDEVMEQLEKNQDQFRWEFFATPQALGECRLAPWLGFWRISTTANGKAAM